MNRQHITSMKICEPNQEWTRWQSHFTKDWLNWLKSRMNGFIKTYQHADGAPGILLPSRLFSLLPQLLKCCVGVQVPGISSLYNRPLLRSRYSGVFNVYISIGVSLLVYGSTSTLPCTCKRKLSSCFKMWFSANLHPAPLESEHCKLGSSLKL